jgi:hypothetical protein
MRLTTAPCQPHQPVQAVIRNPSQKATFDATLHTESQRKEPLDDTSGSVHILAIDVSDTATPSLSANHSQLPLRREIPEHGSD